VQYCRVVLTTGLDILRIVAEAETPLTATAIAQRVGLHVSSVSRTLAVLVRHGYLRKPTYHSFAADLGVGTERLVVGGRSFGGRMSSMAVADGLAVAGLLLLSYPLHPPGRPEQLRIEHLPRITVPVLAVSGATDPFGTPDELATHLATLAGPTTLVVVPGAHGPADAPVVAAVRDWLT